MGKALMIGLRNQGNLGMPSGSESPLAGVNSFLTSETQTQMSATEAATFSKLHGNIISGGGDGANDFRFRVNGANGNQLCSRTGAGTMLDASNTDVLAANDLFNIACTEVSASDPLLSFIAANVEFSSGHGNFHASAGNQLTMDVDNSTRYLLFVGSINGGGVATESEAQLKNRGYTQLAAIQIRVTANARTSTSTFKSRINGVDGGLQVDFTSGATGLVVDSSPADTLADGDLVNISITLGTGAAEDLNVSIVGGTFKSSSGKSHAWAGLQSGLARTASATATPLTIGGALFAPTGATETNSRVTPGFAARCSHLFAVVSANTYTGDSFVRVVKNGSAAITLTIGAGATGLIENTADTTDINDTDALSAEIDEGTSGSATFRSFGFMFSPLAVPYPQLERGTRGLTRGLAPIWR